MSDVMEIMSSDLSKIIELANVNLRYIPTAFNVSGFGAKGDGVKDDTQAVQKAIDAAIAANAKLVFFPPGTYKVSALTNTDKVNLVGDNATLSGNDTPILQSGVDVVRQLRNTDRFKNFVQTPGVENALMIVGDSIAEGAISTNYVNDGWAGIVRKAFETDNAVRNYGFENFSVPGGITKYHSLNISNINVYYDDAYYGGVRASSVISGGYIEATYIGKDARLVYGGRSDGGVINVYVDGVFVSPIDTKSIGFIPNATMSPYIPVSTWGKHTIRLEKADASPTDLMGMIYYDSGATVSPVLHNVSRSGIALSDISNSILDAYCNTGTVILALGVNDQGLGKDINTFKSKLNYCASKMRANGGTLLFVDSMFSLPYSNPYKKAIRDTAAAYPEFEYLDFAQIWFSNLTVNKFSGLLSSDGIHPTIAGQEFMANVILRHIGLQSYSKKITKYVPDPAFTNLTLTTGFGNLSNFQPAQYKLYSDGIVRVRGTVAKSGSIPLNTIIGYLPAGRWPSKNRIFTVGSNNTYCDITVRAIDGAIINNINAAEWINLDFTFELD